MSPHAESGIQDQRPRTILARSAGMKHLIGLASAVLVIVATLPSALDAQALTPSQGDGSVSFLYQNVDFAGHLNFRGERVPNGASHAHTFFVEFDYGLTDRVALSVGLPFVVSRYTGQGLACPACATTQFEFHQPFLDDGAYHSAFQDWRVELRYNVLQRGLFVTPIVGAVIPSHRYPNIGEAAPGRRLFELPVGVELARTLEPVIPRAYFQARYTYSFVQRELDIPLNRSNAFAEVGYEATRRLIVRAIGTWQRTHGGVEGFPEFHTDAALLENHDRLLADRNWRLGGGVVYSLSPTWDTSASVIRVMGGKFSHYGVGFTVIANWYFTRNLYRQPGRQARHFSSVHATRPLTQ
jgi:hypothetical protein